MLVSEVVAVVFVGNILGLASEMVDDADANDEDGEAAAAANDDYEDAVDDDDDDAEVLYTGRIDDNVDRLTDDRRRHYQLVFPFGIEVVVAVLVVAVNPPS